MEVACFVGFEVAENYGVLCLIAANGESAVFHGCETHLAAGFDGRVEWSCSASRNPGLKGKRRDLGPRHRAVVPCSNASQRIFP
jgi:hypothetical protein